MAHQSKDNKLPSVKLSGKNTKQKTDAQLQQLEDELKNSLDRIKQITKSSPSVYKILATVKFPNESYNECLLRLIRENSSDQLSSLVKNMSEHLSKLYVSVNDLIVRVNSKTVNQYNIQQLRKELYNNGFENLLIVLADEQCIAALNKKVLFRLGLFTKDDVIKLLNESLLDRNKSAADLISELEKVL